MQLQQIEKVNFTLNDILDIFNELIHVTKQYISNVTDVELKEIAKKNLEQIEKGIVEALVEYLNLPKGYHIAYKKLDNQAFAKEIFSLFFKGILDKKEVEYYLKFLNSEDQFKFLD